MTIICRSNRVPVKICGPDAPKFLRDLLTGQVIEENEFAHWWALLSPQGKIQAEGLLSWWKGAFWLDVSEIVADTFIKRLGIYRLRADIDIVDARSTHRIGWTMDVQSKDFLIVHEDRRAGGAGFRIIAEMAQTSTWSTQHDPFTQQRISLGLAELGADFAPDKYFPHDIAMDLQNGIDFEKGCYVGQEVVSRMRHKSLSKRRPLLVSGIVSDTEKTILVDGKPVGEIGQVVEGRAIGIFRLDRLARNNVATLDNTSVSLAVPDWADYAF